MNLVLALRFLTNYSIRSFTLGLTVFLITLLNSSFSQFKLEIYYDFEYCFRGFRVVIHENVFIVPILIGDDFVIGANTEITKDIPSGSLVVKIPGKIIKTGIKTSSYV